MKLKMYFRLLPLLALPVVLSASSAFATPWHYYNWRGKMTRIANSCNDPSAPATMNASFREQSLAPLGFLKDNTTGLQFSMDFFGGSKNFVSYLALPLRGCTAHFDHTFRNIDRSAHTASVTTWYYFDCLQAQCFYKYKGNLHY